MYVILLNVNECIVNVNYLINISHKINFYTLKHKIIIHGKMPIFVNYILHTIQLN